MTLKPMTLKALATLRVPRPRWGGRWLKGLATLDALSEVGEDDGKWYEVALYAGTTGYQVARSMNMAQALPAGRWEFGTVKGATDDESVLVARRRVEEKRARVRKSA